MSSVNVTSVGGQNARRVLWLEVGAIAGLCILPAIWATFDSLSNPPLFESREAPWSIDLYTIVHYLHRLFPTLFILWVAGERFSTFGFARFSLMKGVGATLATLAAVIVALFVRTSSGSPVLFSAQTQEGMSSGVIWGVALAVAYITNEFILRGYIIRRVEDLGYAAWLAVTVSVATTAVIGMRSGWVGLPVNLLIAVVTALSFKVTGSIWPGVIGRLLALIVLAAAGTKL
jgi:membrane protease YdiL (CAAX protease family)